MLPVPRGVPPRPGGDGDREPGGRSRGAAGSRVAPRAGVELSRELQERIRERLCELGDHIRDVVVSARDRSAAEDLAQVAAVTDADAIYRIDRVSDEAILGWLDAHWPSDWPTELVMEGLAAGRTVPADVPLSDTRLKCILDPIDGTRGLMYDKRSAWVLCAVAPQRGGDNRLSDLTVAAMTEIPTRKQWRADQISAVRGAGRQGVSGLSLDVRGGGRAPLDVRPSTATGFRHGFASIARFFPEGKASIAELEEALWAALGLTGSKYPLVFDDQYISTGGQLYELAVGHDRMLGDLRPLVYRKLGLDDAITCHPYDICTALVLTEAGAVLEAPDGRPLDAPLDTTSPVAWMGYANESLATLVRPVLKRLLSERFGETV